MGWAAGGVIWWLGERAQFVKHLPAYHENKKTRQVHGLKPTFKRKKKKKSSRTGENLKSQQPKEDNKNLSLFQRRTIAALHCSSDEKQVNKELLKEME